MLRFKSSKKRFTWLLIASIFLPTLVAAQDEGYNFTKLDIPEQDQSYYTEDLWEVTDEGVFDEKGQPVSSNEEAAPSKPALPQTNTTKPSNTSLSQVKGNLAEQQKRYDEVTQKINETQEILYPLREQMTELQEQVDMLDSQINLTKEKITNVEVMVAEKQIQIKESLLALQQSELEVDIQKDVVLEYIKLLYQEESKFFDLYDDGASSLKLLLSENTVAENLAGEEYLAIMEETGREVFHELNEKRQDLAEKQLKIVKEQEELEFLYRKLNDEKKTYEQARQAKEELLEATQGEEEKYSQLLEESLKQQEEASAAVAELQNNVEMIEAALKNMSGSSSNLGNIELTPEMIEMIQKGEAIASLTGKPLSWPVPPNKVTAEFHDSSYPSKWGAHNAIDIRAAQYTPIMAADNALVAKAKDNGMGYSYIVLAHANGLSTVYGHVSEIMVKEGMTVKRGDVIGLSGGTPGTKGAGLQTTGAHLHFEVHKDGRAVDPLDYLPVSQLPTEYIPDSHMADLAVEKAAQ